MSSLKARWVYDGGSFVAGILAATVWHNDLSPWLYALLPIFGVRIGRAAPTVAGTVTEGEE